MPDGLAIAYDEMPDDAWRRAGQILMSAWAPALEKRSARAVVRPLRSPDGAIVPYLLEVRTELADGMHDFLGAALIWDGKLLNKQGAEAATRHLRAVGFPAKRLTLGHLVETLYVTHALPLGWLTPPVPAGWDAIERKLALLDDPAATLEFEGDTALLTLNRAGSAIGGGLTPPPLERLQVQFARDASFTIDAARRIWGSETWVPFQP